MDSQAGGNKSNMQFGVEKLVGSNYNCWWLCMEAFLPGQDLWDLMVGNDTEMPPDTPNRTEAQRKWKVKCGKALFALRTTVSKELIDHIEILTHQRYGRRLKNSSPREKQAIISLSSTKVEYVATTLAAQEIIWIKSLVLHKVDYTMELFCDNEKMLLNYHQIQYFTDAPNI